MNIIDKIDSLPPLPKTIQELEDFKKSTNKEIKTLANIVERDPLLITTILKTTNSALFGFRSQIETVQKAVGILGINYTLMIAFDSLIKDSLNFSLSSYNITTDDLLSASLIKSKILYAIVEDDEIAMSLSLPIFLQEVGKFIISKHLIDIGKSEEFKSQVNINNISELERKYVGYDTYEVTYKIFEKWGLTKDIINSIKNINNSSSLSGKEKLKSELLHIIGTVGNPIAHLSTDCKILSLKLIEKYNLNKNIKDKFINVIENLK